MMNHIIEVFMQVNPSYVANSSAASYVPANNNAGADLSAFFQAHANSSANAEVVRTLEHCAVVIGIGVALTVCIDKFVKWKNGSE
jgi:hypothetical protein